MSDEMHIEPTAIDQPEAGLSWKGLWLVLSNPVELFSKLKAHPRVLVAWLAAILLFCVYLMLVLDKMVALQLAEVANTNPGFDPEMIPEGVMEGSTFFFGALTVGFIPLITAIIAIFWGNFIFGGKATFKQVLSVALYGNIIYIVGMLATLPLVLAKDSMMVSYSLAAFFPDLSYKSVAYAALSKVGIFYIWEIIVAGIGFSTVYGFTRGKGYTIAVLSVGLLSILHVAFTALGSLVQVGGGVGG